MIFLRMLIEVPLLASVKLWAWLWGWTYPLSRPTVAEALAAVRQQRRGFKRIKGLALFTIDVPLFARAQHRAERDASTRTGMPSRDARAPSTLAHSDRMLRWLAEPLWRSWLRETLVWGTLVSWTVTFGSIAASLIITGNFLFETHATPDAEAFVTVYFKVAALAFALPVAWGAAGLGVLGVTRSGA